MSRSILPFIIVVVIAAAITLVSWQYPPEESHLQRFLADGPTLWFLGFWTLAALPLVFWMPRMRANVFGRSWRVPSRAYVLPSWLVWLILAFASGQVAGAFVLTVLVDPRIFWLFGSSLVTTIIFTAGAWHRLRHPREEFEMPWPLGIRRWRPRR